VPGSEFAELPWRKSSFSGVNGCVETAVTPDGRVAVRDSKNPTVSHQYYSRREWLAFCAGVRNGEFDYFRE